MNIIESINDSNLFKPFLADRTGSIDSWSNWTTALRCLYGLKNRSRNSIKLIKECSGRDFRSLPADGFNTALFLTGRRSGKSRMAAVIGAYESCLSGRESLLAAGEMGLVVVIAPSKKQARIVKTYLRSIFDQTPMLQSQIVRETQEGFDLQNGISIEILVGDWRTVRGYSLLAAIIDEICFMGLDAESKVRSDSELVRAVRPSLTTTQGKLICISSPYAQKGWAYRTWKKNYANDKGKILVWRCPSMLMNPLLDKSIVDDAMEEDPASARSEYYAEWRTDVQTYLPREVIEQVVIKGRTQLMPREKIQYRAFCDMSGGRADSAALAIGHKDGRKVIIDFLKEYKPPFSPHSVAGQMAAELKRYNIRSVTGDRYAGEYTSEAFRSYGIKYSSADKNKSELYIELIGPICSREIELLDDDALITQLSNLERRTRSGGRDIVDHPTGQHDDKANAVAGCVALLNKRKMRVGGMRNTQVGEMMADMMFNR